MENRGGSVESGAQFLTKSVAFADRACLAGGCPVFELVVANLMALRIALIGQAAFACEVLKGLCQAGHQVAAVYCPEDKGARADPLKDKAESLGIAVFQPPTFKDEDVQDRFRRHEVDLGVLAYVTRIVPMEVIAAPRYQSICFHPSLLPRHRGGSAVNWTLIHGDEETGVTVFWPDAGIDTGPVLLQKRLPVDKEDSAGSLYFSKLFPLGVEAVIESVELVAQGRAPRVEQDEGMATYEPLCRDQHAKVSWNRPAAQVHNLIRGCDPRPGAFVTVDGSRLRLYRSRVEPSPEQQPPGTVLDISQAGLLVKAADGALRIALLRREGEAKGAATEVAKKLKLEAGAVLSSAS